MIYFVTSVRLLEFPNFYIDLICSEKALEDSVNELNDSAAQEAFTQQAVSLITWDLDVWTQTFSLTGLLTVLMSKLKDPHDDGAELQQERTELHHNTSEAIQVNQEERRTGAIISRKQQ